MKDVAERCGALVTEVHQEWGRAFEISQFRQAAQGKKFKLVCVVHAETSTGVLQDLSGFRGLADQLGALLLVDCVTSLGGMPVQVDRWGLDAAYSGTQKCLSCPPGLSPVTFSKRATDILSARKGKVQSWYLDLSMIRQYWGTERVYHHTAPINMIYALHEALRLILEEGLEARFARHQLTSRAFAAGLEAMGLSLLVPTGERLPSLMTVKVPEGVDELKARKQLLEQFGLEIGGGLGPLKGKIWRVGLMGAGSTRRNITLCLTALQTALGAQGFKVKGDPLGAVQAAYDKQS
jgi:alanine-glyoxylate transaminase/serine-glyoxylate transaminase/serine-pyruvate transaminase